MNSQNPIKETQIVTLKNHYLTQARESFTVSACSGAGILCSSEANYSYPQKSSLASQYGGRWPSVSAPKSNSRRFAYVTMEDAGRGEHEPRLIETFSKLPEQIRFETLISKGSNRIGAAKPTMMQVMFGTNGIITAFRGN